MFARLFGPKTTNNQDDQTHAHTIYKHNNIAFKFPVPSVSNGDEDNEDSLPEHKGEYDWDAPDSLQDKIPVAKSPPKKVAPSLERARVKESVRGTGQITRLNEDTPKGIIDGKYMFSREEFCKPGCQFSEGSTVDFEAEKCLGDSAYTVVSMKVHVEAIDNPDEGNLVHSRKFAVKVAEVREEDIVVLWGKDQDLYQIPMSLLPVYRIKTGDWLRVEVRNPKEDTENGTFDEMRFDEVKKEDILCVEPSQRKTVLGKLIKRKNFSFVDKDIYVSNEDLNIKAHLHSGSSVRVTVVESEQKVPLAKGTKIFKWRAIEVGLSTFATYMTEIEDVDPETKKREEELLELLAEKKGVRVTPREINFSSVTTGNSAEKEVEISNISDNTVMLRDIRLRGDQTICDFIPVISRRESEDIISVLKSNDRYVFKITCRPTGKGLGRTKEICIFDFGDFKIAANAKVNVLSNNMEEVKFIQRPTADMRERINWKKKKNSEVVKEMAVDASRPRVKGIQPVRPPFFMPKRIPIYQIPPVLWTVFEAEDESLMAQHYPKVMNPLSFDNYKDKFSVCLWFEELENDRKRRETDLKDITLTQEGDFFHVKVPGLKDFQPPLCVGDPLDVLNASDTKSEKYEGFIHKIVDTTIHIKFPEAFYLTYKGESLNVQFRLGRMTFKRNHYAVHTAVEYLGKDFLFPKEDIQLKEQRIHFVEVDEDSESDEDKKETDSDEDSSSATEVTPPKIFNSGGNSNGPNLGNVDPLNRRAHSVTKPFFSDSGVPETSSSNPVKLKWINKFLNQEQKEAVRRILQGRARPIPYIIFGPPGTGKTITLVESIIQINLLDSTARLLVCAPSNAAADVIAMELIKSKKYKKGDFVRLNGYMRMGMDTQVSEQLKPFCVDGEYLDVVMKHKIIICTCVTAGQMFMLNLEHGHFTHVLVDEAGYCTEPETMIPTVLLALEKGGQLILAGDPFQLGPVLMSDAATNIGMQVSFLQRLMERHPLYQRNVEKFPETKYNPNSVTKLVKNYRTNETLLKIPSQLFYDDELIACASHEDAYELCQDPKIRREIFHSSNTGVPIVFHGIQGNSSRDPDSPSWFNSGEILEVMKYIRALKRCGLSNDDIGVITPYRKQVDKIKQMLLMEQTKKKEKDQPKVGSVEEFQGGERKVIIISTVRSIYEEKIEQQVGRLTFIYSHKRFNVALTRAKALLILIGNPHILCKNKNWRLLITYCKELGTCKGCNLPVQLEPQYLKEIENEKEKEELVVNPPDKSNKHYNPDGIDESDEDEGIEDE